MTAIVSCFAGPGAGKSTSSAYLYSLAKNAGYNAELVREYVKDWAWENRHPAKYDQFYFFGKQVRKESMLLGKVDLIITDSPVWVCGYYAHKFAPKQLAKGLEGAIESYYGQLLDDGHKLINIWLSRGVRTYNPAGRYQTAAEASIVDDEMLEFLDSRRIMYDWVTSSLNNLDRYFRDNLCRELNAKAG